MKGTVKGLNISYELIDESDNYHIDSSTVYSTTTVSSSRFRTRSHLKEEINKSLNRIDFKLGVNKFKSQSFCIKNHSGIQTSYKLILKNYLPFKETFKGSSNMSYEEAFDNHNANMIINELSDTSKLNFLFRQ